MSALRKMSSFLGYPAEETYDEPFEVAQDYAEEYVVDEADYEEPDHGGEEEIESSPQPVTTPDLRRIVTVHPSTYNEARIIGEAFRDGVPVIMNLTNMSESDARRMVDFSAGLVFGLHGAIERVTPRVFLLTPATVDIDGGERSGDAHGRLFNQS